jgi:ADP-heptose:LPS heptosyltransferase
MKYILAPFSNMPSKMWRISNYLNIILYLNNVYNLTPVIFCSKEEYNYALEKKIFLDVNIEYVFGNKDFDYIFNEVKSSIFYLGNDTGIMHVAAHFNIPIFSIFSSRDLQGKWEPDTYRVKIYRNKVDCEVCLLSTCPYNNKCTELTSSSVVLNDIDLFLKNII